MKRYCHIVDNVVATIEPEFSDVFPEVPFNERYSQEFINNCVIVDEDVEVHVGWEYKDGVFFEPEPIEVPPYEEPPGEVSLTEAEILHARLDTQDEILEELLFEIIPMLMEGGM